MSSPIDGDGSNDKLKYAPPWARQAPVDETPSAEPPDDAPDRTERDSHPRDLDAPEREPVEIGDAPATAPRAPDQVTTWLRAPARPFAGDVAVRELRARMALEPQIVPEPHDPPSRSFGMKHALRVLGVAAFAAGVAYGIVVFVFPDPSDVLVPQNGTTSLPSLANVKSDRPVAPSAAPEAGARLALIEKRSVFADEPAPLAVTLIGPLGRGGAVVVSGIPQGARVLKGAAQADGTWRIALADLTQAAIAPAAGFVGAMDMTVELRLPDDAVADRSAMRIEWAPAQSAAVAEPETAARQPAPPSRAKGSMLDPEELAILLKRGQEFIANGDLASARLLLRRGADGGDAQAALLLGSTYDPAMFKQLKVIGAAPDLAQARNWYQRAAELGSAEAVRRLEPLARGVR